MKKLFVMAVLASLFMGCLEMSPERKEVKISNKYSSGYLYVPQSSIVSDNATHMVISIDKIDSNAEIVFKTYNK